MTIINTDKPLVYSCSGCSNVAQLANDLAIKLNSMGIAEMSCISGVGGNIRPLVKLAKSGRPIIALDGCPLSCVAACLAQHGIKATHHLELTRAMNLQKRPNEQCTNIDLNKALTMIISTINT
ncbi:zinc-binding protein [Shewanella frigidimarina]|uniref:Zinc-binding protein n=2 Tax=Shewanella frigidimarina TaxID=56812 RepID=A0A119D109_SHEFR|nr:zinc-binding protein [Shewanella frigidimarina]